MMQFIVDMLQIVALWATITLGVLLLITMIQLRKVRKMNERLIMQIEEGRRQLLQTWTILDIFGYDLIYSSRETSS